MPRLGVLLVRAGAVLEESVNRALAVQNFAGGRLGTLLLERGSVSEDDVGMALAGQHHCDYIPWRVLGAVPPAVTAALPAKFAIRHSAVPVESEEGYIKVVLRDPANLRILDELFFVTGKKIVPSIAPEVRIYQALEKYYGERRTPRFAILAEKLSRPTLASVIKKPLPPPPDFTADTPSMPGEVRRMPDPDSADGPVVPTWTIPDAPAVGWSGLAPPAESEDMEPESIQWEELPTATRLPAAPEPGRSRAAASGTPAGASAWRSVSPSQQVPSEGDRPGMPTPADFGGILAARGRDQIFKAVLGALSRRFPTSAVFVVRNEGVYGLAGVGERLDAAALQAVELPWAEPSIFLNVRMSRSFYLGPLPPLLPRHRPFAAALGGWPEECLIQPVLMRDKTVAFLYGEGAGAQGATPADLTFVRELAEATAAALAASIRLKKQKVI